MSLTAAAAPAAVGGGGGGEGHVMSEEADGGTQDRRHMMREVLAILSQGIEADTWVKGKSEKKLLWLDPDLLRLCTDTHRPSLLSGGKKADLILPPGVFLRDVSEIRKGCEAFDFLVNPSSPAPSSSSSSSSSDKLSLSSRSLSIIGTERTISITLPSAFICNWLLVRLECVVDGILCNQDKETRARSRSSSSSSSNSLSSSSAVAAAAGGGGGEESKIEKEAAAAASHTSLRAIKQWEADNSTQGQAMQIGDHMRGILRRGINILCHHPNTTSPIECVFRFDDSTRVLHVEPIGAKGLIFGSSLFRYFFSPKTLSLPIIDVSEVRSGAHSYGFAKTQSTAQGACCFAVIGSYAVLNLQCVSEDAKEMLVPRLVCMIKMYKQEFG